jgi:hypothetical protein
MEGQWPMRVEEIFTRIAQKPHSTVAVRLNIICFSIPWNSSSVEIVTVIYFPPHIEE